MNQEMDAVAMVSGLQFPVPLAEGGNWAEPVSLTDELPREGSPSPSDDNQRVWLAFLVNLFAHRGGIAAINKVGSSLGGWACG